MITPTTYDAYRLFHDGALALAQVTHNGIRIDTDRLETVIEETTLKIKTNEETLRADPIYRMWKKRFGDKTKLGSHPQLASIIFEDMGHKPTKERTKTDRLASDEEAFESIDLPFVKTYFRTEKLKKLRGTYLKGLKNELVGGVIHPFFNLHTAVTYRSSSDRINFQNVPIRDEEIGTIIRSLFVPRKGRVLIEIDFGALEFKIAACFWKDPGMVAYASDPTKDIHRDMAAEHFMCEISQVSKAMRQASKTWFVFPILYGSYYLPCALHLWDYMNKMNLTLVDGTPCRKWLKEHGVKELGDQNRKASPRPKTYEACIKASQDRFNKRFPLFGEGKTKWWNDYLKTGSFQLMTGFRAKGIYSNNFVMNCPIQGPAFHLLLKSLILIQKHITKHKLKTLVIGQIHDCLLLDVPESELQDILHLTSTTMTKTVPNMWDWIIVPISAEVDVTPLEGTWYDKKPWVEKGGMWVPKADQKKAVEVVTPIVRNLDPVTSHIGASDIQERITARQEEVIRWLKIKPDSTQSEVDSRAKYKGRVLGKRFDALVKAGRICISGTRCCSVTGRQAQTYRVQDEDE